MCIVGGDGVHLSDEFAARKARAQPKRSSRPEGAVSCAAEELGQDRGKWSLLNQHYNTDEWHTITSSVHMGCMLERKTRTPKILESIPVLLVLSMGRWYLRPWIVGHHQQVYTSTITFIFCCSDKEYYIAQYSVRLQDIGTKGCLESCLMNELRSPGTTFGMCASIIQRTLEVQSCADLPGRYDINARRIQWPEDTCSCGHINVCVYWLSLRQTDAILLVLGIWQFECKEHFPDIKQTVET